MMMHPFSLSVMMSNVMLRVRGPLLYVQTSTLESFGVCCTCGTALLVYLGKYEPHKLYLFSKRLTDSHINSAAAVAQQYPVSAVQQQYTRNHVASGL